jgi:hypothetical protein
MNRFLSIVGVDLRFRFRKTATLITILIVAMAVYFIVPDIRTGRTLMQVEGRRVIYNSPAVALGTAILCSLLISLFGFYLAGNSFRRDILSRVAFVLGGTPVRNDEYVVGKFLGGAIYLAAVFAACMLSAMVMFLIRGEGALEPFVFLSTYLWIGLPTIVFCASLALLFESLPALSGRVGDLIYFFLWATVLGLPVSLLENNVGPSWIRLFDIVGIVPIMDLLQKQFHSSSMSIGLTNFKASLSPVIFNGILWSWEIVLARIATIFFPLLLLILAVLGFHRFDPTKIKSAVRQSRKSSLSGVNKMLKPLKRLLVPITGGGSGNDTPFFQSVRADVLVTFMLSPVAILAVLVFGVLSVCMDTGAVREGLVPAIVAVLILLLGDGAIRDRSSRTMNLLFTAPHVKRNYILLKFLSALIVTLCFTSIPLMRLASNKPSAGGSLFIGSCFISGGAVGLGMLTGNRKAFIAVYLMLLYIALNVKDVPLFDFAGFLACATPVVQMGYAAATVLALVLGQFMYRSMIAKM